MTVSGVQDLYRLAALGVCLLSVVQGSGGLSGGEFLARARSAARAGSAQPARSLFVKGSLRSSTSGEVGWRTLRFEVADRHIELREVRPNSRLGEYRAVARGGDLTVHVGERQLNLAPDARRRVLNRLHAYQLVYLLDVPAHCLGPGSDCRRDAAGGWTLTLSDSCGARKASFSGAPERLRRILVPMTVIPGAVQRGSGSSMEPLREGEGEVLVSDYRLTNDVWIPYRVAERVGALEEIFDVAQVANAPTGSGSGRIASRNQRAEAGATR